MPSALPINNRRKPNYLITPSHCVQTELPVVDNKYLISEEAGRINQGLRRGCLCSMDVGPGLGFPSCTCPLTGFQDKTEPKQPFSVHV